MQTGKGGPNHSSEKVFVPITNHAKLDCVRNGDELTFGNLNLSHMNTALAKHWLPI